jgi:hypothetical protein
MTFLYALLTVIGILMAPFFTIGCIFFYYDIALFGWVFMIISFLRLLGAIVSDE